MAKPAAELDDDGLLPTPAVVKQIMLDLDRTFYTHRDLMDKGGPGQQRLFNILAVYAAKVNPKVPTAKRIQHRSKKGRQPYPLI